MEGKGQLCRYKLQQEENFFNGSLIHIDGQARERVGR